MEKLFGTDGVRGIAGQFPLDYTSVYVLGQTLINLLQQQRLPPQVIIGRDTRESGAWLEQALVQGITEGQGQAFLAGIIPTSAISFLTKKYSFSAGVVISASHNPYQDNGIKIFSSQGIKISESWENKLERSIREKSKSVMEKKANLSPSVSFGDDYLKFLKSRFQVPFSPPKIKIVLDCSNGASSFFAPKVFKDLGFEVITLACTPNGKNINDGCGSLYPQNLAQAVVENKADIGIAYDGDADRAIWVDEKGRILNGDHTLFVLAKFMKESNRLKSSYIVATTMSNLGLEKALESLGLKLQRAQVGDKYVLEEMIKLGTNLGGEQSGHTIFLDDCMTGDGILTSLKMLEVMSFQKVSLSELIQDFEEYPQILLNVRVSRKEDFSRLPEIKQAVDEVTKSLKDSGRFHLRYSGTEPVARIMIEGKDQKQIELLAQRLADLVNKHLGE